MNNYSGPMTAKEYLGYIQEDAQRSILEQQVKESNARREAANANKMTDLVFENYVAAENKRNAFSNFSNEVKEALLAECLDYVFEKAVGYKYLAPEAKSAQKGMITGFIRENGVNNLLSSFRTKSVLLSEFAYLVNKYHKKITEACDKLDPTTFHIDQQFKNDFLSELDATDAEAAAEVIKTRTGNAIEEFITSNMSNKLEIQDILDDSKNRIDSIKTVKDDERAAQEAAIQERCQKKINHVRKGKPKSVFSTMVQNMASQCIKEEDLKAMFTTESGKLDMDSIVEFCELSYTMLEMVNTLKMVKVDENYIMNFLSK